MALISPEDRERLGLTMTPPPPQDPTLDVHPPPKSGGPEKKEQSSFANWLLLQNSYGKAIPFSWHSTAKRSTATPGTPDFWVGVGHGIWIEFKRDYSADLSDAQEEFRHKCQRRNIPFEVVYSAHQAIKIVEEYDNDPLFW